MTVKLSNRKIPIRHKNSFGKYLTCIQNNSNVLKLLKLLWIDFYEKKKNSSTYSYELDPQNIGENLKIKKVIYKIKHVRTDVNDIDCYMRVTYNIREKYNILTIIIV